MLESKKRHSLESHWDDPMMEMIERDINHAKHLRPDLQDSAFPRIGKDLTPNHPSYRGHDPSSPANVLARTEEGVSGWKNVQSIIKAEAETAFAAANKREAEAMAHKAVLAGAGLIGARIAIPPAVRYAGRKLRDLGRAIKERLPRMIPKMADATLIYPAMMAASIGVGAIKAFKDNKARQILHAAIERESVLKAQSTKRIVGAAVGAGAVGAGAGYIAGKKKSEEKKAALDPVTLGMGGLAALASTALALKQIKDQRILTEAVNKANLTRRLLLASLAASTGGGVAAGYALGRKQPKSTEKTILMQPVIMQSPPVVETKAAADDPFAEHRNALRKMINPVIQRLPGIKKIEAENGPDIITSSVLSDDSASGASK